MKTSFVGKILFCSILAFTFGSNSNAQFFKKLAKKAERAAERTVERRVERETEKKTDQALDSILEPGSGGKQAPKTPKTNDGQNNSGNDSSNSETSVATGPKTIKVYSKFDFVPGDKLMFFDDFAHDFVGDFPSKWNTNGGGEIVSIGDSSEKWLELISGYSMYYIPDVPQLPEEYTIEFDLMTVGINNKTSSNAKLRIDLSNDDKFKEGSNFVQAHISVCQYTPVGITMENRINNQREIYSVVNADLRDEVLNRPHISIAVNKQRFRLWVNEEKHIDIPRIAPTGAALTTLKFHKNGFKEGEERLFITNLKVAEGGVDLRRKLISEGRISTNGILFDSGSANIQPQSMGIIRQISQVLLQESAMNIKIVGHTDADGSDDNNMKLSQQRAEAVKSALVSIYGISADRLVSEGKGELEPVGDNSTIAGKAQNRRVEFIKQ